VNVTTVEVQLVPGSPPFGAPALVATATVEFDGEFVVKGLKLIETGGGRVLVQFPDRPVKTLCPHCGTRYPITHKHCHGCAADNSAEWIEDAFRDICHPTKPRLREAVNRAVIDAYEAAVARSLSA
jgi:DNA-binding cell septation regulator SpoVG